MRRTQLYLDDSLWNVLHARALRGKTTISHLVREAVRERYLGNRDEQIKAMREFIGIRRDRRDLSDTNEYIRSLRKDDRLERFTKR